MLRFLNCSLNRRVRKLGSPLINQGLQTTELLLPCILILDKINPFQELSRPFRDTFLWNDSRKLTTKILSDLKHILPCHVPSYFFAGSCSAYKSCSLACKDRFLFSCFGLPSHLLIIIQCCPLSPAHSKN